MLCLAQRRHSVMEAIPFSSFKGDSTRVASNSRLPESAPSPPAFSRAEIQLGSTLGKSLKE